MRDAIALVYKGSRRNPKREETLPVLINDFAAGFGLRSPDNALSVALKVLYREALHSVKLDDGTRRIK